MRKNPAAGLLVRGYRKGHLFGWYSDSTEYGPGPEGSPQQYNVLFKDSDASTSFGHEDRDFEYLDTHRYDSPGFVLGAVKEFMNHFVAGTPVEEDVPAQQKLTLLYVDVAREYYLERFRDFFPGLTLTWTNDEDRPGLDEPVKGHGYTITIEGETTLAYLTDYVQLLSLFLLLVKSDSEMYVQDSLVGKYVEILNRLRAPYYLVNLFKTHFLSKSPNLFKQFKGALEENAPEDLKLAFGSSHTARIQWIRSTLNYSGHVLDVGCGEGRYLHLTKKLSPQGLYVGVDTDLDVLTSAIKFAERKQYQQYVLTSDLDDALVQLQGELPVEAVMTEVIEHMPQADARSLIQKVLSKTPNLKRLLVTTPNKTFNANWNFSDDQMRHDDHDWEPTREEFQDFLDGLGLENLGFTVKLGGVGDEVNGEPLSFSAIFTRHEG
jgi:small RNA 2'-O-methyltransferase